MNAQQCFQDFLPGHVCFGCGSSNPQGLGLRSYWDGEVAVSTFQPQPHHEGWPALTCGGIVATLADCHCIATAMATAVRNEGRDLGSDPHYLFVTGSLQVKFLKPAETNAPMHLQAQVASIKLDKKYTVRCQIFSRGELTSEAEVIALLVYRSDRPHDGNPLFVPK